MHQRHCEPLIQYKIPFMLSNSKPIHLSLVKRYYYCFYGVPLGITDSIKKLAVKTKPYLHCLETSPNMPLDLKC